MAVARFTPEEILRSIRYDPLTKKGSVYDVVQLVTGCDQRHASRTFQRILDVHPNVHPKRADFKFPGQGQRPTPVAYLKDLVEIAWLCPGKHAKEFRRTGAVTMCRALGGDLSLVDEIRERHSTVTAEDQEALLAGTGVTAAEANGQALAVPDEEQLRRYRAETLALEVDARHKTLEIYTRMVEQAGMELDERDKLFFQDAARNFIRTQFGYQRMLEGDGTAAGEQMEQVTISEVAQAMGVRLRRGEESSAGKAAAQLYREAHGVNPPKHKRFVDGAVRSVNLYFEKDRDLLEHAIRAVIAPH